MTRPKPVLLAILDGWGQAPATPGNAVRLARTPNIDKLLRDNPKTMLSCSGPAVGLQEGQMGDSNVGHLNIGAGRVVWQDLVRISRAFEAGELEHNPTLAEALKRAQQRQTAVHFMGLVSDGGVHSHINHLISLVEYCAKVGVSPVFVHVFTDGRDVPPESGAGFVEILQNAIKGKAEIATVSGRYYAMDRDKRWDRVEKAYRALVYGEGVKASDPVQAVRASYQQGVTDEFIAPTVIERNGQPIGQIRNGDVVLFFNFRSDRAREISRALTGQGFDGFDRGPAAPQVDLVGMTRYDETLDIPVLFAPQDLRDTMGEAVSRAGFRQLRIAETEKYAHVTFFFNGGEEVVFPGEDRALIPSPKVATYDLQPRMSAPEVTEELLKRLDTGNYDFIVLNFANLDMVGHTGILNAAVEAVETIDSCLDRVLNKVEQMGGAYLVTADHGNAESMIAPDGSPQTAHTLNQVACVVHTPGVKRLRDHGVLADISPTLLEIMQLAQPQAMTGVSLICHQEEC
jgi:2,3-bisphosphoglycerate-independent phosphoglycerate mutase